MASTARESLAFTDLDSTLIYPARLATGRWADAGQLTAVERVQGRPVTVMPCAAAMLWTTLVAAEALVPATTRTKAQYSALTMPGSPPRIAITGNGGDILYDGQPDFTWRRHIERVLAATSAPFDQVAKKLGMLADRTAILGRPYAADRLYFILATLTPPVSDDLLAELYALAQPLGWRTAAHGRRIYVLPASLDKQPAVDHVRVSSGADLVFAAGDSELDERMLASATGAIRPPHGALHQRGWTAPHCTVATCAGLMASQEILEWLATKMREDHHDADVG